MYRIKNEAMLKDVKDSFHPSIIEAVLDTPREIFLPPSLKHFAYTIGSIPMSYMQFVSSPLTVMRMTSYLLAKDKGMPHPDSVLEIGLGSGYQAVILAKLVRRVFSIERIQSLADDARVRISNLGIMNINIKFDDGYKGWDKYATYDRILFSACCTHIPHVIFDQLSPGGVIVAPQLHGETQHIMRYIKLDKIYSENCGPCEFVVCKNGVEINS